MSDRIKALFELEMSKIGMHEDGCNSMEATDDGEYLDKDVNAMFVGFRIAFGIKIPEKIPYETSVTSYDHGYAEGWNDCLNEVIR